MVFPHPRFVHVVGWTVDSPALLPTAIAPARLMLPRFIIKLLLTAALATHPLATKVWAQQISGPPDFSGIWGHPYWPSFEPPATGAGPVTNRSRLRRGPQAGVSNPNA